MKRQSEIFQPAPKLLMFEICQEHHFRGRTSIFSAFMNMSPNLAKTDTSSYIVSVNLLRIKSATSKNCGNVTPVPVCRSRNGVSWAFFWHILGAALKKKVDLLGIKL